MRAVNLGDLVFWLLIAGMVVTVIVIIARGSLSGGSGAGMTAITALHDLSPADKQSAIEIVVEENAGKKWMEQESGKGRDPEKKGGAAPTTPATGNPTVNSPNA